MVKKNFFIAVANGAPNNLVAASMGWLLSTAIHFVAWQSAKRKWKFEYRLF